MSNPSLAAETTIHLRARARDKELIDRAADLIGANRSQFMLASALKEAKSVLLDQSTIFANADSFRRVMEWMDAEPTDSEAEGMKRVLDTPPSWHGG